MLMARLHRRNFLHAFIVNIVSWIITIIIILFFDPEKLVSLSFSTFHFLLPVNILLFFLALTISITLTFSFLFVSTRRGFFLSLFVDIFLVLRLIKQAFWWNILILTALFIFLELFFSRKRQPYRN